MEGYETGEHAPGLRMRGTGAYKAAHHIIKVLGRSITREEAEIWSYIDQGLEFLIVTNLLLPHAPT